MTLDEIVAALHEDAALHGWRYPDLILAPPEIVSSWRDQTEPFIRKRMTKKAPIRVHGVDVVERVHPPSVTLVRYNHGHLATTPAPTGRTQPPASTPA